MHAQELISLYNKNRIENGFTTDDAFMGEFRKNPDEWFWLYKIRTAAINAYLDQYDM